MKTNSCSLGHSNFKAVTAFGARAFVLLILSLGVIFSSHLDASARILANNQSLNVDACLNDIKKVEAGVSCLFASTNSECAKNAEAAFGAAADIHAKWWKDKLPGSFRPNAQSMEEYQSKYRIPGNNWMEDYLKYFYRVGIVPPSYVLDAVLIARYGFWTGGLMSWTAYLVAIYLPEKGFEYVCDNLPRVGQLSSSVICSKSVLRPQAHQILMMSPEERYEALMNPASKIYPYRKNICEKYFGNLARNLEQVYKTPIGECSRPTVQKFHDRDREIQSLNFDGRPHWITDFSIWWENEPSHVATYVMKPANEESNRKYRQMAQLFTPSFRDERTTVGFKEPSRREKEGLLGTHIVTDIVVGVPPSDEHMKVWLNRPRIYKACELPILE